MGVVRYFCEDCGASERAEYAAMLPKIRGGRAWESACPTCDGLMLDLSYLEARGGLEERVDADRKRRENLRTAISAPFAFAGLAAGGGAAFWLYLTLPVLHIAIFAIPLVTALACFVLPSWLLGSVLKPKKAAIELSLGDVEELDLMGEQRRMLAPGDVEAPNPNSVF